MVDTVGVFIDYENMHRSGHNLYADLGVPIHQSVLDPLQVAERLVSKRSRPSTLSGVWVFRGRPVPAIQPRPASANDVQAATWSSDSRVRVVRRDLKYESFDDGSFLAREKGIDVALAVGLVERALDRDFDAAIVFSGDTDLLPALELVFHRRLLNLEIAAWTGQKPLWFPEFLSAEPPRRLPYCHFLSRDDFEQCRDYIAASG